MFTKALAKAKKNILRTRLRPLTGRVVVRGHGGTLENRRFKLGPNQYVVYVTTCGLPGSMAILKNPTVQKFVAHPELLQSYIKNERVINNRNLKQARVLERFRVVGPGQYAANTIIEMKNNYTIYNKNSPNYKVHKNFHNSAGIWNVNTRGQFRYLGGRGNTRHISQIIGTSPGYYFIDSCRVVPGMTQEKANKLLKNLVTYGKTRTRISQYVKNVRKYENEARRKLAASGKRKRVNSNLNIHKQNTQNVKRIKYIT